MKTTTFVAMAFIGLTTFFNATAQNNVGVGTTNPDPSAVLEASSTTQGFLPPRMTEDQRDAIAAPVAAGLIVWCTNCGTNGETQVYNGTAWTNMVGDPAALYTPVVGDAYRGGIVAYIFLSTDPGYVAGETHGLIASTVNLSTSITYGPYYGIPSGTLTVLGAGYANTTKIIALQGNPTGSTYAANLCRNHSGGGFTDWSLPSPDELGKFYLNRAAIGGFTPTSYWTSRNFDTGNNWAANTYNFDTGAPFFGVIGQYAWSHQYAVRAVRYF